MAELGSHPARSIAIFLPDLRPGGAEKLHVGLAADWCRRGVPVDFVLRQARGALLDAVPDGARVIDLGAKRVRNALRPLVRYLRKDRPSALLAAMWPLTFIAPVAARLSRFEGRVVVSEHAPQSISYAKHGGMHNALMSRSMKVAYRLVSARVAVSSGVAEDLARLASVQRAKITVIHNPAATGRFYTPTSVTCPFPAGVRPVIMTVGTLKPVKRHDVLIRAFAKLEDPDARLCIVGDGPERQRLESLTNELGLSGRVLMPGFQSDPGPWYAHADLFVLTSEYEGFGNVLVEALEQGTPVVSTDCPFGPREILENGRFGTLVPVGDVDALAVAMKVALSSAHDRAALMRRAADFSLEKASTAYLDLLLPGWRGGFA